jgi:hypothetical protein
LDSNRMGNRRFERFAWPRDLKWPHPTSFAKATSASTARSESYFRQRAMRVLGIHPCKRGEHSIKATQALCVDARSGLCFRAVFV